jgi:hypothetical protein
VNSINSSKVPAVFNAVDWVKGTINADIGGGKFNTATSFLSKKGVKNVIFDPHTRDPEANRKAAAQLRNGKADTATVSNVLNVIKSGGDRAEVIRTAANAVGGDGVAYFSVYEGDGSGKGTETSKGWQENRGLDSYVSEIKKHFSNVERKGSVIVAKQGKAKDDEKPEDKPEE